MLGILKNRFFGKSAPAVDKEHMMVAFRKKYAEFKVLLESNAELLKIIAGMEEKLEGRHLFGVAYIRSETARAVFHCARMIESYGTLAGKPQGELEAVLSRIRAAVNAELDPKNLPRSMTLVLPFSAITRDMADVVGGKNANLGEIGQRVGLPHPRGFAITSTAFDEFIEYNDLTDEIRKQKMALEGANQDSLVDVSRKIQQLFHDAEVPPAVTRTILEAYDREIDPVGKVKVALRSSAQGEDGELSFAGQYKSVLNVPRCEIIAAYKEVLASLFAPVAVSYRLHMGTSFENISMGVMCLEMVTAKAAGVVYTRHPSDPAARDHIIINAAWGQGAYVVDGKGSCDTYDLCRTEPPVVTESRIASKTVKMVLRSDCTLTEVPVDPEDQNRACLSADQARRLAEYALRLETHFQSPQDVEWALDDNDRMIILQSRPLTVSEEIKTRDKPTPFVEGFPLLIESGDVACPGVGCGPARIVQSESDLLSFPDGGILVAAHSSPQFALVMGRTRAIVADSGSLTGHMASLAREFRVPTLLNTRNAAAVIASGMTVTVDAVSGRVYKGKVNALLDAEWEPNPFMRKTPVYQTLQTLSRYFVPLNLLDPKSPRFTPGACRTVHDIMRYIHERSYGHIFQLSDLTAKCGRIAVRLNARIPIDLHIIDLGGGLDTDSPSTAVTIEQLLCEPLKAVLGGMLHRDLKPMEPRPINVSGFFSVIRQQMFEPPNRVVERFGDKSYAIISDKYLNFSSRVGYHYSIIECYCGIMPIKNHISFQFKGGAADDLRRNRRARLICRILEANNFIVEVQGDRVAARFLKQPAQAVLARLDMLGCLLIYSRQMDMLMNSEARITDLADRFLAGRYHL